MSSYMTSMLRSRVILEEQERERAQSRAWHPPSYQGAYEPSTSIEYQPDHSYAQGNQYGYGERFQPSDMAYDYEALYPSQISIREETINLMKLFLERQEKNMLELDESIRMFITKMDTMTLASQVVETTGVESINTDLSQWTEDNEEECISPQETVIKEALPNDIGEVFEKNVHIMAESLLEAEDFLQEFELLFGCTVDENHVLRYEAKVEPVTTVSYSTKSNGEGVGMIGQALEDPCEGVVVIECVVDKHLGITSTNEVSIAEPRKILFEDIRMKEFRGWFYDEYDPGDTCIHLTLTQKGLRCQAQ